MVVGDIEDDEIFEKSDEDEDIWVKSAYFEVKSR